MHALEPGLAPFLSLLLLAELLVDGFLDSEDVVTEDLAQAEIDDLDRALFGLIQKEEVLRLQISMADLVGVAVVYRLHDLGEDVPCQVLSEDPGFEDAVEELPTNAEPMKR